MTKTPQKTTLSSVTVSGFRAFLRQQEFRLERNGKPVSMAVFAANAKGKSSLVDALEFFLSGDGTLRRLGVNRSATQGGREALSNVLADTAGVSKQVTVCVRSDGEQRCGTRTLDDATKRPGVAVDLAKACKADLIIRGYELRRFVEERSPSERYRQVADWLGLEAVLAIERNLRDLRLRVQGLASDEGAKRERLRDLSRLTNDALTDWALPEVVAWVNDSVTGNLPEKLAIGELSSRDRAYRKLRVLKAAEDDRVGLRQLRQARAALQAVYRRDKNAEGNLSEGGAIAELELAQEEFTRQQESCRTTRESALKTVFTKLWEAAERLLEDESTPLTDCPVCLTPFSKSPGGSRQAALEHIQTELEGLGEYRKAQSLLEKRKETLTTSIQLLKSKLQVLGNSLDAADLSAHRSRFADWLRREEQRASGNAWDCSEAKESVRQASARVESDITRLAGLGGTDAPYATAFGTVSQLMELRGDLERIDRERQEATRIVETLMALERQTSAEVRTEVNKLLGCLDKSMQSFFSAVQGEEGAGATVRLDLDIGSKLPSLKLVTDFGGREGVPPAGYLSDSQVHTLALALRLATIRVFNPPVSFLVLDDVVVSYDAEHRLAIAKALAQQYGDMQLLVVTHDERFFAHLRGEMPPASWAFKRIGKLDLDFGPRFDDHLTSDEAIEERLRGGEPAANDIRQAQEEWLLRICRDFRVQVYIRPLGRPYEYSRSELATALASFLKKRKLQIAAPSTLSNRFLETLAEGNIENFGSHFQDNPNAIESVGDERIRWAEFKAFRDSFRCPTCAADRFKRPQGMKSPVCAKCETPFGSTPDGP